MDLLAGYSDEGDSGKNTPTQSDRSIEVLPVLEPVKVDTALEAEWKSFEKMIGGSGAADSSGPPPLPVAAPQMPDLSQSVVQSEPPNLTTFENSPSIVNHVDPPVLANMTEPPKLFDIPSSSSVPSQEIKTTPPKLTDVTLSSEFNSDVVFEEHENEMPTLTKMTGSPSSSLDHSSSRSSSSGSRSSSVESVKSVEKKSSSPLKKSPSPSRGASSNPHKKDEKRSKHSRSHSRSRSRSRERRKRRSSDRKRSRSRERKRSDRRRRSRSRGKRRHQSSHSRSKRRSRSRSRHRSTRDRKSSRERHKRKEERSHRRERKNRSRDRDRSRDKSRERHRRSHSRERRRSRSGSPIRGRERFTRPVGGKGDKKPLTFKEQMRQQLLKASKILSEQGEGSGEVELPKEKPSSLPLNANNIYSAASTQAGVTPQMALLHTMAAMHQKAQEMTGVAVPKYYNPAAVNPLKYAEQVQKRKLLWSKNKDKKEEDSQWQSTAFVQDDDGKMAAKFRKLMGMKEDGTEAAGEESEEQKKKTEEMFYRLDKEYEFARMTTHTHRGIGLGFQSQGFPNP